ncbi:hypothetical protein BDQ17DRAFT_229937 [Cyathus striatus]|nr:hypothetical protein BDQ17DRAFT_229937 [Cyathus striatus]
MRSEGTGAIGYVHLSSILTYVRTPCLSSSTSYVLSSVTSFVSSLLCLLLSLSPLLGSGVACFASEIGRRVPAEDALGCWAIWVSKTVLTPCPATTADGDTSIAHAQAPRNSFLQSPSLSSPYSPTSMTTGDRLHRPINPHLSPMSCLLIPPGSLFRPATYATSQLAPS